MGSHVYDSETGKTVTDLIANGQSTVVACGGKKGLGNVRFKSSLNVRPQGCMQGEVGEEGIIEVELKSIADIGLVSVLSSLISIYNGNIKISNYKKNLVFMFFFFIWIQERRTCA